MAQVARRVEAAVLDYFKRLQEAAGKEVSAGGQNRVASSSLFGGSSTRDTAGGAPAAGVDCS